MIAKFTHSEKLLWIQSGKKLAVYVVEPLFPDARMARKAFRLVKADGEAYVVAQERYGPSWTFQSCTCADHTFRHRACRHILALREVGLMPEEGAGHG